MKNLKISELEKILKNFFKNKDFKIKNNTKIKDVKGWDSLNHIKIIVLLEKQFKIKFSGDQIYKIKNMNDILKNIYKK
jgi:acyl carrier protein|tara:strand:- start:2954 stop:3187 length:234 start_codon:yes stop_codon:yes gene_type:complete